MLTDLGAQLRGADSRLRRRRVHGRQAVLQQLVAAGVVPLVAAARHLRGLLPRRQRPVGPGDHVALRLPDQRPELHGDRRAAVRLPGRHPLPRRGSARVRCRSIGRTSRQGLRQLRVQRGAEPRRRAAGAELGQAADGAGGEPELHQRRRDSADAARRRHPDAGRLPDADAVRVRDQRARRLRLPLRRQPAARRCSPTSSTCSICSGRPTTTTGRSCRWAWPTRTSASPCRRTSRDRSTRRRARSASAPGSSSRGRGRRLGRPRSRGPLPTA